MGALDQLHISKPGNPTSSQDDVRAHKVHAYSVGDGRKMESPSTIPRIVQFGFKEYSTTLTKRGATCNICNIKITDTASTTSNFIRHFRTAHRER